MNNHQSFPLISLFIALLLFTNCGFASNFRIEKVTFIPLDSNSPVLVFDALPDTEAPTLLGPHHWQKGLGIVCPAVFPGNSGLRAKIEYSADEEVSGPLTISASSSLLSFRAAQFRPVPGHSGVVIIDSDNKLPDSIGRWPTEICFHVYTDNGFDETFETKALFLTTLSVPVVRSALFRELVEFACDTAAGLTDEKRICDTLIEHLPETGLHYGRPGWSTFQILCNRGGMCGGWCRVFQDLCGSLGINVGAWFFTLRRNTGDDGQRRWMAIDIHDPGLNNEKPTMSVAAGFVDHVYPNPRYFSKLSGDDDVDYYENTDMYRFATVQDGHCVNFLEYRGRQYMYDPSFGKGPFGGFFKSSIPQNTDMSPESLAVFRKVYLDASVDHLMGRILCRKSDGGLTVDYLSPLSSLVPDGEVKVYWQNLDGPPITQEVSQTVSSRVSRFNKLFATGPSYGSDSNDRPIDFLSALSSIQESTLQRGVPRGYRRLLLRRAPVRLRPGSQLPGLLPPLQMLQKAIVSKLTEHGDKSLDREIEFLKSSAGPTFKALLNRIR